MKATLIGKVLGGRQRDTRRDDALDGGVIGQIEEQHGPLQRAVLLKVLLEEVRSLHGDSHGGKNNGKLVASPSGSLGVAMASLGCLPALAAVDQAGLAADLGGNVIVGETCRNSRQVVGTTIYLLKVRTKA